MFLSKIVISKRPVYTYKCEVIWNGNIRLLMSQNNFFFFFVFCFLFFFLGLDYFSFQLLSELCFPTWLFAFAKVCFKLSDQASMTLSQTQPTIISHQTVGSLDTSTLWHTGRYTHSRTTINTLSFPEQSYIGIPLLPTLVQFSNDVCQVVHLSPYVSNFVN